MLSCKRQGLTELNAQGELCLLMELCEWSQALAFGQNPDSLRSLKHKRSKGTKKGLAERFDPPGTA